MSVQTGVSATTHVIFDYGGTLCDFAGALQSSLRLYANQRGKEVPRQFQTDKFCETIDARALFREFLDYVGSDEDTDTAIKTIMQSMVGIKTFPGVEKLFQHLYDNNIPMAIATNGAQPMTLFCMNLTKGLEQKYFSHYVFGGDDLEVKANKPAPDVYLVCAQRFKPPPQSVDNCVVFEDSLIGITGAVASGMKTVLINDAIDRKSTEFNAIVDKITVIVDSFEDFRPESVGLPPYQQ